MDENDVPHKFHNLYHKSSKLGKPIHNEFPLPLDNSFIILDEAQNTTPAQMKMFLTRIGFGSKAVITGDATQKDLAPDAISGLDTALKVLKKVDEIAICELTSVDVVRHPVVQKIVKAYEDYEAKGKRR